MERKCTYRQHYVQDNAGVAHKYVRIYCNTNKFPALPFCVPNSKPHGRNGFIDQGKYKFFFVESKSTDRQYHVQDNSDVAHKDVRMYCNKN